MTITAEARTTLAAALVPVLAPWPVHPTIPDELGVPCCYLDVAGRRLVDVDGATVTVVTLPVVLLVDGTDAAQVARLDDLGDAVWDTALRLNADPTAATAGTLDVGGPRLRTLTTLVDVTVEYVTLCREAAA